MKLVVTTLSLMAALAAATPAFSQVFFSCEARKDCVWNNRTEQLDNCNTEQQKSLFTLNEGETVLKHTTDDITSSYYIQSKEHDTENDRWNLEVVSDAGNKYSFVLDIKNNKIYIFFPKKESEDTRRVVAFTVRRSWK